MKAIILEEIVWPLVGVMIVLAIFGGIVWFMAGGNPQDNFTPSRVLTQLLPEQPEVTDRFRNPFNRP